MTEGDSKTTSQPTKYEKTFYTKLFEVKTPPTFNAEPENGRFDGEIFVWASYPFPKFHLGVVVEMFIVVAGVSRNFRKVRFSILKLNFPNFRVNKPRVCETSQQLA